MAKVYVSILPQPNYVCAVSLNLGGNRLPSVFSLANRCYPTIMERDMFRRVENKMIWVLWFMLGLIWAWGIVAVVAVFLQHKDNVAYQKLDVPPIVNTVETIPVDVYKLEKVIVEY